MASWRPAAVARKAAAADQDPDQGEDLQLDPRGQLARAAPRKAAAADLDPGQGEDPQLGPRGHGGHGGVLAPAAVAREGGCLLGRAGLSFGK